MKKLMILLGILLIIGCTQVIKLKGVEVRDYEGVDLSSINDFRENSIKGPQKIDINSYELRVTGLVKEEQNYSYDELLARQAYSKVVTLYCVEGWDVTILWQGVLVKDLFEALPEANTVIFKAADGYTTSLSLDYVQEKNLILAYKINNVTLPIERGYPLQLVAEDKWGYKWIKWVTEIELSNDSNYKGFWESRGYNNNGSLSGPKLAS